MSWIFCSRPLVARVPDRTLFSHRLDLDLGAEVSGVSESGSRYGGLTVQPPPFGLDYGRRRPWVDCTKRERREKSGTSVTTRETDPTRSTETSVEEPRRGGGESTTEEVLRKGLTRERRSDGVRLKEIS